MKQTLSDFASAMGGVLRGEDAAFHGVTSDSRSCAAGELFFALSGERFDGHDYVAAAAERGIAGVVVNRYQDLSVPQILVSDVLVALQTAAAKWRRSFQIPVVGVAGSNGKTTTKEMIAAILGQLGPCLATKGTLNNHIGVPMTLLRLTAQHRSAVIEIGANHPGEVAALTAFAAPTIGLVTNAGAEHLEGFGSVEGAAQAEGEMFAGLDRSALAVMNADDAYFPLWTRMNRAGTTLRFGESQGAEFRLLLEPAVFGDAGERQMFSMTTPAGDIAVNLGLAGRHNIQNALAAGAAAFAAGCTPAQILAGLNSVRPVKGRLEVKLSNDGGCVIDDSYNANPSSLQAGLAVLAQAPGERWLVLGNMAELGPSARDAHRAAGEDARQAGVTRLFALGNLASDAAHVFGSGAEVFLDCEALVDRLKGSVVDGVTVLIKGSRVNRLERVVESLVNSAKTGV
jgi:UDP-N-acetylmuramoyl-tripeptide--D-alanyl-D-alanine ligase